MIVNSGLGSPATTGVIASGVSTAGAITAASLAIPVIGPIAAGISILIGALGVGAGCGQSCIASTNIVNAVEPYMRQNVSAANSQASANGGCLTSAEQQQLAANFQTLWNQVTTQCGQVPPPGGTNCIQDRQRGGKFDWFNAYLDPIMAIPVCAATSSASSTIESLAGGIPSSWLLYGGIGLIAAIALFSGGKS